VGMGRVAAVSMATLISIAGLGGFNLAWADEATAAAGPKTSPNLTIIITARAVSSIAPRRPPAASWRPRRWSPASTSRS